jgi:hypothetical protein
MITYSYRNIMVRSKLDRVNINYEEFRAIDAGDIDYSTVIYDYTLANENIEIALGKEKHTYSKYNVVYFSIYLVVNDAPISRIGVFEINNQKLINSLDEDGAIDLQQGNILIFVEDQYLQSLLAKYSVPTPSTAIENEAVNDEPVVLDVEVLDNDIADDVMRLAVDIEKTATKTPTDNNKDKRSGIFKIDMNVVSPPLLSEESQQESDQLKTEFTDTVKATWIEKFTHNNRYSLIDNEGSGDCFFAVIRDAFHQIGHITSVGAMRTLLAKEVDDALYQEYRTLYINILSEYQEKEKEMKAVHKKTLVLKKLSAAIENRSDQRATTIELQEEQQRVLGQANELIRQYQSLSFEKKETKQLLSEFEFMRELDSIDKFREYVKSSRYWADTWAISTLERLLNIKIIVLSEEAFNTGEKDAVMQCGQLNDSKLEEQKTFTPDYYIITSYTGNHYKLVSYKEKQIFRFREIPYDIKTMVVNKCLERNAGPYYLIQDFRNYKSKIGIDADVGRPEEDDYLNTDLYNKDVIFMFHSNSNSNPKPGYGSGEQIQKDKLLDYKSLNKLKNWRRKLSDEWPVQITIDGHRWSSVMHYYLGSQYKKGFPDFYLQFASDSGTELSKNVEMAIAASSKSGKYNNKLIRPANVKVDPDFYEISNNSRSEQERYTALNAKITQNQDMKQVLMETLRAKLTRFVRGREPEVDIMLMKLRKEFS